MRGGSEVARREMCFADQSDEIYSKRVKISWKSTSWKICKILVKIESDRGGIKCRQLTLLKV
jgi:hypothetical protein